MPPKTIQVIFFFRKNCPDSIIHPSPPPPPHYQGPCPDCGTFSLPSATRARNAATNGQGMVLESGWCLWGATQVDRVGRLPKPDDPCMDYLLTLGAKWLHSILPSWSIWATRASKLATPQNGNMKKDGMCTEGVHVLEWVASVCPSIFVWGGRSCMLVWRECMKFAGQFVNCI